MHQVLELHSQDYDGSRHNIFEEKIDAAFRKIKPHSIGFYTWKVENGRVESVARERFGVLRDNETYIVYAAAPVDSFANAKTVCRDAKPTNQVLNRFIHFWLGANTSAERSGAVAYKVIELDNQLANTAVQYREAQGNESVRFRSYFKDGIIILSEPQDPVRLFQLRGKKCPTCVQRPVDWTSFSSESTMLLQTHNYVFVWLGRSSSQSERRNGLLMAHRIKDMYQIPEITTIDDGYEKSMGEMKKSDWNTYLSLNQRNVHPMKANNAISVRSAAPFKLYRCGFANSKYRIEEVKTGSLVQSDLNDATSAFILDGDRRGVWIWMGRLSSTKDKAEAMRNARGFVKKKQYESTTPVIRVIDGSEPLEFKRIFPSWYTTQPPTIATKPSMIGKFDAQTLQQRPKLAASTQLIDDGSGSLKIYQVPSAASNKLIEIPIRRKLKALFSGDCYLVHYTSTNSQNNLRSSGPLPSLREILYLWIGAFCSSETAIRGEQLACDLFRQLQSRDLMQVCVHEGWEPPHFLQIFQGKLIIFNGKSEDYDVTSSIGSYTNVYPTTFLLKVSGDATYNSKAVQVTGKSTAFVSKDCLVLNCANNDVWVWCGQGSTGDKREMAKSIGTLLGEYSLALESSEPDEFWHCLPERIESKLRMANTDTNGVHTDMAVDTVVGLYIVCSADTSGASFQQILPFDQSDLTPEDVYLLDVGSCIFVWVGDQCSTTDPKGRFEIARHFLSDSWAPRSKNTPIALVQQGSEPVSFVGHFPDWNSKLWETYDSFDMQRSLLDAACKKSSTNLTMRPIRNQTAEEVQFDQYSKYPLDVLRSESSSIPDAVDHRRKEIHLTHDDFVAVFNMTFADFEMLPNWRKQQLKKAHKLF